jgi:hypothetical protein
MEEKKTWVKNPGSGIGWLKALLVSYLISVLLLLFLSFLLWKFSWKESWVQAGIVVIYLASSFCGGRMTGNMAEKRRVSVGNLFRNRVFCRSYHSLCRLFAGRLCRSRKASVGGSRLCGRRNGRGDDSTWQVKTRRKQNKTKENLTQTEYFLKKQTFKFEKPML